MSTTIEEVVIGPGSEPAYLISPDMPGESGVLFLHWFDEAPNANRSQFVEEAKLLADRGVTSLLPQLSFPWSRPPTDASSDLTRIEEELDGLRACLGKLREMGGDRIAVVGHDFGAMYGALLMTEFSPACGVLIAATPRWSDWFLPFWQIEGDRFDYMRALDTADPINAVGQINAPLLFQFGKQDFYIAPMTGSELYRAASEPKTLQSYETGHAMDSEQIQSDRLAFLAEHLGQ